MADNGFKRQDMKGEVAKGDLNVEVKKGQFNNETLKLLMEHQAKMNKAQYIAAATMVALGIAVSFINKNGIGIAVGSLVQGGVTVSDITVNLGALLVLAGFFAFLVILKNSNTSFKEK